MSLELARSTDTGNVVAALDVYNESINEDSLYSDKSAFTCLDENCGAQLTLVNFNNPNKIQKPHFITHQRSGHTLDCIMKNGTNEEQAMLVKSIVPNMPIEKARKLTQNANAYVSIVDSSVTRQNSLNLRSKINDLSNDITDDDVSFSNKNTKNQAEFHNTEISSLGSVFIHFSDNPDNEIMNINWPSLNKEGNMRPSTLVTHLVKKEPFKIREVVSNLDEVTSVTSNKVQIFYGKVWVNFEPHDYSNDVPTSVAFKFVNNKNIQTKQIPWGDLKGFTNIGLLRNMYKKQQNWPITLVLSGHFFKNDIGNYIFVPRKMNDLKSWLFIPDQD